MPLGHMIGEVNGKAVGQRMWDGRLSRWPILPHYLFFVPSFSQWIHDIQFMQFVSSTNPSPNEANHPPASFRNCKRLTRIGCFGE